MEFWQKLVDLFLHLDPEHLRAFSSYCGVWIYLVLFLIVFCETGLVVTPFLPGDSLLFAVGAVAAMQALDPVWVIVVLCAAAILGDSVNYQIGKFMGPKVFHRPDSRWLKKEHLDRTHAFFEKYGGKTIIIARFVPIVRTFAPFVAGVGAMTYWKFLMFNVVGGLLWVGVIVGCGLWFGKTDAVQKNFKLIIVAIIIISILPAVFEFWRTRRQAGKK